MAQRPTPSSDTSTSVASPVRSRWNRAPHDARRRWSWRRWSRRSPAPAGPARGRTPGASAPMATPDRAQKASDVVGALVGVGAPLALAGAAHVDDARVVGPDVVDVDVELGAHARELVGEEDVAAWRPAGRGCRGRRATVRSSPRLFLPRLECSSSGVHVARHLRRCPMEARPRMASPRSTCSILIDLGSPVGQEGRGGRHEGVLGDLEDADAVHHCGHLGTSGRGVDRMVPERVAITWVRVGRRGTGGRGRG